MNEKKNIESRGLPGGPNEVFTYVTGVFSTDGYKRDSPDVNNPFNLIDSGNITMEGVDFPVVGTDNLGNQQTMMPGGNYQFPGNQVFEMPIAQDGGPKVKQRRGVRENPDGSVSSHLMRAEYIPERGWVGFPSLFQDSKPYADDSRNWVDMSETPDKDWMKIYEEAERRGEVYDFGEDKEAALAFGMGSWKGQLPKQQFGGTFNRSLPMAQDGIETTDDPPPWIQDYNFTQGDIDFLNDNRQYCPNGGCLEQAYKAQDIMFGGKRGFPTSTETKESLDVQSANSLQMGNPYYNDDGVLMRTASDSRRDIPVSEKKQNWLESTPYFDIEEDDYTADSWDIHGIMVNAGGKNLFTRGQSTGIDEDGWATFDSKSIADYSESELKELYSKIPIGTIIGFDSYDKDVSYNREHGLTPSGHSTMVVGFNEQGVPVVYDYGNYTTLQDYNSELPLGSGSLLEPFKQITNITYPPNAEGKTYGYLKEQGMFDTTPTKLDLNYDALETELYEKGDREALTNFHDSLVTNKHELMNLLDISNKEYDMMSGVLLAQTMQESSGGTSFEDKYVPQFVLEGMGETQGLTQLNINNLLDDELLAPIAEKFGITEEADLFDPKKAAIASIIFAKRNLKAGRSNYKKGKGKPGLRTFYPRSDIRETAGMNVNITFNGYEFKTEEGPIVDFVTGNSFMGMDKSIENIQAQFDEIAPGKYKVREEEVDVDFMSTLNPLSDNSVVDWAFGKTIYVVDKITEGNKGTNKGEDDLTDEEIFAYNWQSPNALRSGDARGDSEYAKNVLKVYNKLRKENKKRMGGQIMNEEPEQGLKKFNNGGSDVSNVNKKVYKAYFNKEVKGEKAKKVYDKLNRVYYRDAKAKNMSSPNYILTHVIT